MIVTVLAGIAAILFAFVAYLLRAEGGYVLWMNIVFATLNGAVAADAFIRWMRKKTGAI